MSNWYGYAGNWNALLFSCWQDDVTRSHHNWQDIQGHYWLVVVKPEVKFVVLKWCKFSWERNVIVIIIIPLQFLWCRNTDTTNSRVPYSWFIWQMQVAVDLQSKSTDLGCKATCRLLWLTFTIAIIIITQPKSLYSFYRPMEGGRLSQPKHTACNPI